MSQTKKLRSMRNTGADCEKCEKMREEGANFCGKCGKQLKEEVIIRDYKSQER